MEKIYDMANFFNDYNWVIKNLESVESKKQLNSVETLFDLWKKKYKSKKFNKLKSSLSKEFLRKFVKKDNMLWNK